MLNLMPVRQNFVARVKNSDAALPVYHSDAALLV